MTTAAWPSTLPQSMLVDSFQESPPAALVRTDMEVGPAKVRPRSTVGVRMLSGTLMLSAAQQATLDAFFTTTLINGALTFFFPHPRTKATVTARFLGRGDDPGVQYAPVDKDHWRATLRLEILP